MPPAVWQSCMVAHCLKISKGTASPGACFLCARDEAVMAGEGWPLKPADGLVLGVN